MARSCDSDECEGNLYRIADSDVYGCNGKCRGKFIDRNKLMQLYGPAFVDRVDQESERDRELGYNNAEGETDFVGIEVIAQEIAQSGSFRTQKRV